LDALWFGLYSNIVRIDCGVENLLEKYTDKFYKLLQLKRHVVGIKFFKTRTEYEAFNARELKKSIPYCVAVKSAMSGHCIKLNCLSSGCSGGNRALGLIPATMDYFNGKRGADMGLCVNTNVASSIAQRVPICKPDTFGIAIQPIEKFDVEPDVVLVTTNARNAMRIIQGYTYHFGVSKDLMMSGNQAVCIECTVNPLINEGFNVSMLCSGTRYNAGWHEDELMVGINYKKYSTIVDGIERTVNPVESDDNKARIEQGLKATNNLEIEVEYGKTYYKAN